MKCEICGDKICDGEVYIEFDNVFYHLDCFKDNYTVSEILNLIGVKPQINEDLKENCEYEKYRDEQYRY